MPRITHFEIHANDPARAAEFYSEIFGWKLTKWEGPQEYWMITTGDPREPGINGGLMKRHPGTEGTAVIAYVCSMDVDDLDAYVAKVIAKGGTTATPKMAIPGMGWLQYCKDPEGNIFGMMQVDKEAK